MALFAILCFDKPGALELRMATRPTHLDYLSGTTALKAAGPFLDADGKPEGSMLIVEFETEAEAKTFADNDPYNLAGLFQRVEVRPWRLALGAFA
jgi:uncharacterized protein YciI